MTGADVGGLVRVLLADDQSLVRAGFRLVLERDERIEVVAEAADGASAVALTEQHRPDVVVMDIRMPVVDGIEATRRILAAGRPDAPRVIMLTTYEQDDYIADALRAGASGFMLKDVEPEDLRRAVHVVAAGDALLSPTVTRRLLDTFRSRPDERPKQPERLDVLTPREREVVALVGRGLSTTEIGRALFMSPATAKTHVNRAMSKLHARDRAQLVVIAHETGLVAPD
ncbi:response regulator [Geodermatophilus sabuli]|uniref:Two component transcriptional regulator, LuxR family n=1 Tax=Geodermatophilus sabuli TaxID=1564158 RepID=A0A285EDN7_9ACTN|nr:response regulator transcription factor [Geodermatophilus sabuli]MBB3085412.1 DNA-binding NarL/FixJ family response regulator [Geodermatophilus sabuli]SNX96161.1 two component transcriptional regulator, LuxR family [Geodermatophilus sabuli]